ncbi:MAG: rhodanese-like domain-containing protein [Gammaproteobacteria bacterium]|jgi:rhodanese-related sulfurtransferase|nr:rhodanese-like domain-containing protein [Gammaproteobacteria bacterium]
MFGVPEIDSRELARILREAPDSIQLIDVRTPQEAAQGIIEGAELVPLHLVPLRADDWSRDGRPMVVYCRSGARSAQACAFLAGRGGGRQFINLRGGLLDWARQGLPIVLPQASSASA